MIKVISFDIGGTLIKNDVSSKNKYSLKELAKICNVSYKKTRLAYKNIFQKKKGSFEQLVTEFCKNINIDYVKPLVPGHVL